MKIKIKRVCRTLALVLVFWASLIVSKDVSAQEKNYQLILDRVSVEQQRESGGDRPYFCSLVFQSKLFQPRSIQVKIVESEPHDWVSKSKYNRGRLRKGDHMSEGESLPIPDWMGKLEWQDINLVPFSRRNAVGADIFGAIVISLDNNNTPPHVIRNLLGKLKAHTEMILRQKVGRGHILGTTPEEMEDELMAMTDDLVSDAEALELLFQMTLGSTFNPDRLTGINAYIFPGFTDYPSSTSSKTINHDQLGVFELSTRIMSPNTFRNGRAEYKGSGARYQVNTRLRSQVNRPPVEVNELIVEIQTGGDDLRGGNDNLNISVLFTRDYPHTKNNVNRSARWADNSTHTVRIRIPRPQPLSEITGLRLDTTFGGGMGGDNWNMKKIRVRAVGSGMNQVVFERSGNPLKRFTGDDSTFRINF